MNKNKNSNSNAFKSGSYSALLTVIVILIALFVNILIGALPSKFTELDLSSKQLYSVTATTKAVLSGVDEDVDLYLISQTGEEDVILSRLLEKYADYSSHVNFKVINPDVYPTFAQNYTSNEVKNNDVIVESGDRYKYIPFEEIYDIDTSTYYSNGTYQTFFDGESELTSAVDYVTRKNLPILYKLTGHGEPEMSVALTNAISKANIEMKDLSLLKSSIPSDASIVLLWGATSDISAEEKDMLKNYVEGGGKLIVATDVVENGPLENIASLLLEYDIGLVDGLVLEDNPSFFALGYPYALLPKMTSHEITKELKEDDYSLVTPVVQGAFIGDTPTVILATSGDAYAKTAGMKITTPEREDSDIEGQFIISALQEKDNGAKLLWLGTTMLTQDAYNSYSSGANLKFIMNVFSYMGDENTISIVSKSVDYDYLTINDAQAKMLKIVMLIVIPVVFLLIGIVELVFRRKLK